MQILSLVVLDIRKFKLDIKLSFRLMSGPEIHILRSLGPDWIWSESSPLYMAPDSQSLGKFHSHWSL